MCRETMILEQKDLLGSNYLLHPDNNVKIKKKVALLSTIKRKEKNPTILTKWLSEQNARKNSKNKIKPSTK